MNTGHLRKIFLSSVLTIVPLAVQATGVGLRIGTTGIGGEVAFEVIEDYLNFRVAGNFGALDVEVHEDDLDYDSEIDLQTWMAVLDWHVAGGPFKFVLGGCYNGSEVNGTATPNEPVDIGNATYTPAQIGRLFASADYDTLGGYAGIGFGNLASSADGGWTASLDLGVMYFGEPDLTLESRGGTLSRTPQVKRELQRELDDFSEDYIDWLRVYPVLSFGLAYRF